MKVGKVKNTETNTVNTKAKEVVEGKERGVATTACAMCAVCDAAHIAHTYTVLTNFGDSQISSWHFKELRPPIADEGATFIFMLNRAILIYLIR
jgi:hypothetical protein